MALPANQFFNTTFARDFKSDDGYKRSIKLLRTAAQYKREMALTQVCRQIRAETLRVVYSVNTFAVGVHPRDPRVRAERWIESRPPEVLPVITRLVLQRKDPYGFEIERDGNPEMNCMLFDFEKGSAWTISDDRARYAGEEFEHRVFGHFVDVEGWAEKAPSLRLRQLCHNFRRGWRLP